MLRKSTLLILILFQTSALLSQVKIKNLDVLVDSFLVKNNLTDIPNNIFLVAELTPEETAMILVSIAPGRWDDISNGLRHPAILKYYQYTLLSGQSILFVENKEHKSNIFDILSKERLKKLDEKYMLSLKSRSSDIERTDIQKLTYAFFPKPEYFHWSKTTTDEAKTTEATAEAAIEEALLENEIAAEERDTTHFRKHTNSAIKGQIRTVDKLKALMDDKNFEGAIKLFSKKRQVAIRKMQKDREQFDYWCFAWTLYKKRYKRYIARIKAGKGEFVFEDGEWKINEK